MKRRDLLKLLPAFAVTVFPEHNTPTHNIPYVSVAHGNTGLLGIAAESVHKGNFVQVITNGTHDVRITF